MAKNWYRTNDGLADFKFRFHCHWLTGCYKIYIESQPGYGGRSDGLHPTHRLRDSNGYYVCWTDPIRTESDARTIASLWADKTQRYIRFGTPFEEN